MEDYIYLLAIQHYSNPNWVNNRINQLKDYLTELNQYCLREDAEVLKESTRKLIHITFELHYQLTFKEPKIY